MGLSTIFEPSSRRKFAIASAQNTAIPDASLPRADAIAETSSIKKQRQPIEKIPVLTIGAVIAAVKVASVVWLFFCNRR